MAVGVACRTCGVALPGRVVRCPACGSRSGLGWLAARVGLAVVVLAIAIGGRNLFLRPRVDPKLAGQVRVTAGASRFSGDMKQIQVPVRVENQNQVPVDLIVRVRVHNSLGGADTVVESERFEYFPSDSSTTVSVDFGMDFFLVPTKGVEVDVVELRRSPK
jgi:hypothetical protein